MKPVYSESEIEQIREDYYKMDWEELRQKYNKVSKTTLRNYVNGYYNYKEVNREIADRTEPKTQEAIKRVRGIMGLVDKLFESLSVGQEIKLDFSPGRCEKSTYLWDVIRVRHGRVIQKTDKLLIVQDIDRPFLRQGISKNEFMSQYAGAKVV